MWIETKGKVDVAMKHIPYGYKIVDGKAEIDEENGKQVKMLFSKFLEGESLVTASKSCSLNFTHSQVGRMLEKKEYCGDDFYPEIISTEVFEKVQEERLKRATKLGRLNRVKPILAVEPSTKFKMNPCIEKFADPFEQAEYIYSQIESEVQSDEE
ncbi:recombinase family protein [Enterococcus sp. MMGLQ5-2]|uniref:recombinase family protein n=2 Tax=unclassified Enterococcus TaxID=2608891 RepID=UPI0020C18073|nr:recombinase family protein [Enterococcus sp. MMGLQ5-2]